MRKLFEILASAAIVLAAAAATRAFFYQPYTCNLKRVVIRRRSERLEQLSSYRVAAVARANRDALAPCLDRCTSVVNDYLLSAANEHALGNLYRERELYEKALAIDQRPEIYSSLAVCLLAQGDRVGAEKNLRLASYSGMNLGEFPDRPIRSRVADEYLARETRLRARY